MKPLVLGRRQDPSSKRPSDLALTNVEREATPPAVLSAGSESNISFSSLSPIELPDSCLENSSVSAKDCVLYERHKQVLPESPKATKMVLDELALETVIVKEECDEPDYQFVERNSINIIPDLMSSHVRSFAASTTEQLLQEPAGESPVCVDAAEEELSKLDLSQTFIFASTAVVAAATAEREGYGAPGPKPKNFYWGHAL